MSVTKVEDSEFLYRSIRANSDDYSYDGDGNLRFSTTAFDDRNFKPSVDRSALRTDPRDCRKSPTDGVATVLTEHVRNSCKIAITDSKGKPSGEHAVDAVHRPIKDDPDEPDNPAHCQIECNPQIETGSRFKRLKEALARIADGNGFVVAPS